MRRLIPVVALVGLLAAGCGGSSSSSTAKYCEVARKDAQQFNLSLKTDFKKTFDQFDKVANDYLAAVPPAIKDDANLLIGGIRELETAFKNANYDVTQLDIATLGKSVNDPKFIAARDRINAFDAKNCGIPTPTVPANATTPTT